MSAPPTERPTGARHRLRRRIAATVAIAVLAGALAGTLALADPDEDASRATASTLAPAAAPAGVTVLARNPGRPVPARFLGLSFEVSSLRELASLAGRGNLVSLLRSLGPGVLRFGGISADTRTAWIDRATPAPAWASGTLDAAALRSLRELASRSGWRVILTVGFAHFEPRRAAREVAAARRLLGPWLAGIEIGNEPDAYLRHGFRAGRWTAAVYARQVARYRAAITSLAGRVPFIGPDASGSHAFARWAPALASADAPALLTGHHYPLGCHETPAPTIERLLSPHIRGLEGHSLQRFASIARRSRGTLRLDELNSVSCGGVAGVSDTFASALWASGYIAETMAAGISGVNLHGNPDRCDGYSPLCASSFAALAHGVLTPTPVWYSLLLTSALVGARPLRTALDVPAGANVTATAFVGADGSLRVLIVDRDPQGARALALTLRAGTRYRSAAALALTSTGLQATAGVRLGGAPVAHAGSWQPRGPLPAAPVRAGVVSVSVAPASAVLLTIR